MYLVFFFKQKTAYEMRISDWSSDVCSSDLERRRGDIDFGTDDDRRDAGQDIADRTADAAGDDPHHQRGKGRNAPRQRLRRAEHGIGGEPDGVGPFEQLPLPPAFGGDRKSTRLNSSH